MALNVQTFKTRSLTAVVFVIVMMAGLIWDKWCFIILFTTIHFGCWYEFIKLMKLIQPKKYFFYLPLGLLYITMPCYMMIDFLLTAMKLTPDVDMSIESFNQLPFFMFAVFPSAIIFSIWINDTMAYIVGSFIGKTPFSKISPKKTWEGTVGGAILCIAVIGFIFSRFMPMELGNRWYIIAAICAVFGTAGDLLESKLKRMANVKDSGSIMPGHGGFLDRFDSLLIATPAVWLYVNIIFHFSSP